MARRGIEVRAAHFPGRAPIDAYGNGGFRFAGMSHRGSILCLPSGIHGWDKPETIDIPSLGAVFAEANEIDVFLVGVGPEIRLLDPTLKDKLREAGMVSDAMSTGAAVRTYNVMIAENRSVAAALVAVD